VKLYHNRSGFIDCISENILVFFSVHSVFRIFVPPSEYLFMLYIHQYYANGHMFSINITG